MHDRKRIVLLPGDGIGSEVMAQGVKLLHAMEEPLGIAFEFEEHAIGGAGLKKYGVPLQEETLQRCKTADAVLLGAVDCRSSTTILRIYGPNARCSICARAWASFATCGRSIFISPCWKLRR